MLRAAVRRTSAAVVAPVVAPTQLRTSRCSRFYSTIDGQPPQPQQHRVAIQMIQYAFGHARSQKSADSYADALLVLEQGVSNLRAAGEVEEDGVGMILLAMSTLLHERGEIDGAMDKLKTVRELGHSSLAIQVAALEGLVGLNLEAGQDHTSSVIANECFQLLKSRQEGGAYASDVLTLRSKAIKGLVDLVLGAPKSEDLDVGGFEECESDGNFLLSSGEFHHFTGDLTLAKEFYEKAVSTSEAKVNSESYYLSTANLVTEEVILGATCALGQVLGHSGKFQDAEELLTKALTRAEEYYGLDHPKVGIILTCMAIMFGQKARLERSSSLLIQEGLYRRALDLLKAPSLDSEGAKVLINRSDIVALARGGYAEALSVQQNRKSEGEQLRKWAEASWKNRRLSLAEALDFADPSKTAVVDTRISRVL